MSDAELQQKRLVAAAIDAGVVVAVTIVFSLSTLVVNCVSGDGAKLIAIFLLLVDLLLVLGRDLTAGDRSIGKKLMGIRVVTTAGQPLTFMESFKRNALFAPGLAIGLLTAIIDLIPLGGCMVWLVIIIPRAVGFVAVLGAVAWEVMQIVENTQGVRAGDNLANTRVTW
jgi:uncharacterized RDD family membrane protein YckC